MSDVAAQEPRALRIFVVEKPFEPAELSVLLNEAAHEFAIAP